MDADLREAKLAGARLDLPEYNVNTQWPDHFDPEQAVAIPKAD
jgi:hypothetical protein